MKPEIFLKSQTVWKEKEDINDKFKRLIKIIYFE